MLKQPTAWNEEVAPSARRQCAPSDYGPRFSVFEKTSWKAVDDGDRHQAFPSHDAPLDRRQTIITTASSSHVTAIRVRRVSATALGSVFSGARDLHSWATLPVYVGLQRTARLKRFDTTLDVPCGPDMDSHPPGR